MNGMWGHILGLSIFGESHGKAVGVVINNFPAGIKLDLENIQTELNRRKPSNYSYSTTRKEDDKFEIYSGYMNGYTTGTPLMALIANADVKTKDYDDIKNILRPSHADWSAYQKYGEFYDYRGGGYFSGRLTAGLVFAGAIAKQLLNLKNIYVSSKVLSIAQSYKYSDNDVSMYQENNVFESSLLESNINLPTNDNMEKLKMLAEINNAKQNGDSVGGKVKIIISGIPAGLGGGLFESLEGRISQMIFAIPAIKGIEFGLGFKLADVRGSECNDELFIKNENITASSNNNGGILGGITNGMPIEFNVAIKPTPSIAKSQNTVDVSSMKDVKLSIKGRHDICIVPRVIPVLESAAALVILDLMLEERGKKWI